MLRIQKRFISFLLVFVLLISLSPSAFAATATRKGYTISNSNVTAYSDTALTKKLGTIYPTDELVILDVTSKYVKLTYPISGGTKTGYVPTSAVLMQTSGTNKTATAKITTYRRNSTSSTYGYIAIGDNVLLLGTKGDYTQVKYPVGSNSYKYAFIKTGDANKYLGTGKVDNSSEQSKIISRLNTMMDGSYGNGTYKLNTKYTGAYYTEQCKGFAKRVHELLFGYNIGSTNAKPYNYQINISSSKTKLVGSLTSLSSQNNDSVYGLFAKARPGDVIQLRRSHGGSHTMIFLSASSSSVTVYECNVDGKNTIQKNTYSYGTFRSANAAVSVYTAVSYYLH